MFVAIGLYNAWRAWHWSEVPEVLEGREYMFPMQIPGAIFFATGPVLFGLEALAGHPADGSPLAVVVGSGRRGRRPDRSGAGGDHVLPWPPAAADRADRARPPQPRTRSRRARP